MKTWIIAASVVIAAGCSSKRRNADESARHEYEVTPGSATVGEATSPDPERVAGVDPGAGVSLSDDPARAPAGPGSMSAGTDRGIKTSGTTGMTADETRVPGTTGTAPAPREPRETEPKDTLPTRTGDTPDDLTLTARIEDAIAHSTFTKDARGVTVITNSGVVTLRGSVTTASAKQEMTRLAAAIPGVRLVSNQIQVAAAAPSSPLPGPSTTSHHSTGGTP